MTEKTVSNIVIRVLLDATESIMGTNGLKTVLNYSRRIHFLDDYPDHSFEKNYVEDDFSDIAVTFQQILGVHGLKAVMRQIGKASAKFTIDVGAYDSCKDLPPLERFFKAAEIYTAASARGSVIMEGETLIYDNPVCTLCKGIKAHTPVCTVICGYFDELAVWSGLPEMKTVETHCKAIGDNVCRYEVKAVEE